MIEDILSVDRESRTNDYSKNPDFDLFTFDDLNRREVWDYQLPTLTVSEPNKLVNNMDDFRKKFRELLPFSVPMDNILFAGGSVSRALCRESYGSNDVDIFLYGISDIQEANERVDQLMQDLIEKYREYVTTGKDNDKKKTLDKCNYEYKCIRNANCITMVFEQNYNKVIVQIILRLYKSISEILHGFDLGSCAVGYDEDRVYFTSLSKFSFEYSCNLVDTTRRSTTFEKRLLKYFRRNFEIVFPYLNVDKLPKKNIKYDIPEVCEMPGLVFSYRKINGNQLSFDRILYPDVDACNGDYDIDNLDEYKLPHINMRILARESKKNKDYNSELYFYTENPDDNVVKLKPFLSRRLIINAYDNMIDDIETVGVSHMKKYLASNPKLIKMLDSNKSLDEFYAVIKKCIEKERKQALADFESMAKRDYPLKWVTKNPGSQLTSSVNPIIEDPEAWYGKYYQPTLAYVSTEVTKKEKKKVSKSSNKVISKAVAKPSSK